MKFQAQASSMSTEEVAALLASYEDLSRQLEWFKRELFGRKSERRIRDADGRQLTLGELPEAEEPDKGEIEVPAHRRRRRNEGTTETEKVRFDPSVPVKEIVVEPEGWDESEREQYEKISEKRASRLAQRPGAYVVLRYIRPVYKKKTDETIHSSPAPASVLERSCADVSFLAGLLIDKLTYHLPLYRQHQRLSACGVHLARSTLTNLVHRTAELLEPIYQAQVRSILSGEVLAMDETPIKAGRKKRPPPGRMKSGYFWPIFGDQDEVAFPFSSSRGSTLIRELLRDYQGVLLTDGYDVYERYAESVNGIVHAQCWSHTRRHFEKAESSEPKQAGEALDLIAALYDQDEKLKAKTLSPEKVLAWRRERAMPVVDHFFDHLRTTLERNLLLPTDPFTKAAHYALAREESLRIFLEYPDVPLDTNHVERAIRPIAVGRKNWLFCSTEVGALYVGIVQSLLFTCRLQGVDPYTYLVDVLQRLDSHPAKDVEELTPRIWKTKFAENPMRSEVDRVGGSEIRAGEVDADR
ncbi:MAG: IS66 family transposase [Candidatus Binatia bacterium]